MPAALFQQFYIALTVQQPDREKRK